MIEIKVLTVFLTLLFGQIYGSLKVLPDSDDYPKIIAVQNKSLSERPMGTYPSIHESTSMVVTKDSVVPSLSLALSVPFPSLDQCEAIASSIVTPTNKRKRNSYASSISIMADMTIDKIIEIEVESLGYRKPAKCDQIRKTLQLIAQNNRLAFDIDENNFKAVFGKLYSTFKRDDTEFYLLRFIIMFGADELINTYVYKSFVLTDEKYRFLEAINYLLETKPFKVFMKLFSKYSQFHCEEETKRKMIAAIKDKYPNLPFFDNLFVESLNVPLHSNFLRSTFIEEDERAAFNLIPVLYKRNIWDINDLYYNIHPGLKFQTAALHFSEYYLQLDDNDKFVFILLCLRADDIGTLEQLCDLYPEILSHINSYTHPAGSIIQAAVGFSATECVRFLVAIVPEFITISTPTVISALEFAIYKSESNIYDIFYNLGYTGTYRIDGSEYNLIQKAFNRHSFEVIKYFIANSGPEIVRKEIQKFWETPEKILAHSLNTRSYISGDYKTLIIELFGIETSATAI